MIRALLCWSRAVATRRIFLLFTQEIFSKAWLLLDTGFLLASNGQEVFALKRFFDITKPVSLCLILTLECFFFKARATHQSSYKRHILAT